MAIEIRNALRTHPEVNLSKLLAALELARRADASGTVKMSYRYLAWRLKCHKRTAQRLIKFLVEEACILRKLVTRLAKGRYDWNTYTFLLKFRRNSAHPFNSDRRDKLPFTPLKPGNSALLSLRDEIAQLEKGLRRFPPTPGSEREQACQAELVRLKALLEKGERESSGVPEPAPGDDTP